MGKRGRKSAAELTVRPRVGAVQVVRRPDPPSHLSEEVQNEWREIVRCLDADHFSRAAQPMLEAYCRHAVATREIDRRLQDLNGEATLADYDRLLVMHAREARSMASIGVRLGIACASRLSNAKPLQAANTALWERPG